MNASLLDACSSLPTIADGMLKSEPSVDNIHGIIGCENFETSSDPSPEDESNTTVLRFLGCYQSIIPKISQEKQVYHSSRLFDEWEILLIELGRLIDGWAGPGTIAPSLKIMRDIEEVVPLIQSIARPPAVEVDEGDGYVTLRWTSPNGDTFVLIFNGKQEVIGVHTPNLGQGSNWKCKREERSLLERLDDIEVTGIIQG